MKLRIMSIAIVFAVIFQIAGVFPVFSEGKAVNEVPTEQQEAAELLQRLGFFEGYGKEYFTLDRVLTKAELCTLITKVINIDDSYFGSVDGDRVFEDVPKTHWAAASIYTMKMLGIVHGDDNSMFYPEKTATGAEAVKMLVCALGYERTAADRGGYPNGYISTAGTLGILNKVKVSDKITYGELIMMVYDSFDVELFELDDYSDDKIVFRESKLKHDTILTIRDIYKTTGQITANSYSSLLPGQGKASGNSVIINGVTFRVGTTDIAAYLGYTAEVYYRDDEENVILTFKVKNTEIMTINAEDIKDADIDRIEYYKTKERAASVTIADGAVLIYNGVTVPMDKTLVNPKVGEIKLINSETAGKSFGYDIVIVSEYRHFIVDSISEDGYIYLKNGYIDQSNYLDASEADIFKSGAKVALSNISLGDIISVQRSVDNKFLVIDVLDSVVSGKVAAYEEGEEVSVDNNVYKISKEFSTKGDSVVKIDSVGDFYLDRYGYVFYYIPNKETTGYGFMLSYGYNDGEGTLYIKMINANSEVVTVKFADRVKVLNYPDKYSISTLKSNQFAGFANNNLKKTLFIYELDGEGDINKIELPVQGSVSGGSDVFSLDCIIDTSSRYAYGRIGQVMLNSDTKHFSVVENDGEYDLKNTAVYDGTCFAAGSSYGSANSPIYFYDVERSGMVGAVLEFRNNASKSFKNNEWNVILIDRLYKSVNKDGDVADTLSGITSGASSTWFVSEVAGGVSSTVKDIQDAKRGDLMLMETDRSGDIDKWNIIFDVDNPAEGPLFAGGGGYANIWASATTLFSGYVYYMDNASVRLCYNNDKFATFKFSGNCSYYLYDSGINKCVIADKTSIKYLENGDPKENSFVVLQADRNNITTIIIYK